MGEEERGEIHNVWLVKNRGVVRGQNMVGQQYVGWWRGGSRGGNSEGAKKNMLGQINTLQKFVSED